MSAPDPRALPDGPRLLVVAGPPSSGKTAVIRALVPELADARHVTYLKVDVVRTREIEALGRLGWTCRALVDEAACPDQLLFDRLPAELAALPAGRLTVLETAGLCARCAPYVRQGLALAVLEATAGVGSALKQGPLLTQADLVVVTHGDRLAPAERDVYAATLAAHAPERTLLWFDGLTRVGLPRLARRVGEALAGFAPLGAEMLEPRSAPPRLYCSLCLGRREIPVDELGLAC